MKSDYRIRAASFLKHIYPYLANCNYKLSAIQRAVREYNADHRRHVLIAHGMVRIALITSDYVIKFDYDARQAEKFGGCEDELEFYNFAKEKGFSYLFAEITKITIENHKFYIMPRIEDIGRDYDYVEDHLNENDYDFVNRYLYDMHNENYGWKDDYPVIVDYALNTFFCKRRDDKMHREKTATNSNL